MFSHELIAQDGALVVFLSVPGASLVLPVPAMPTLIAVGASSAIATGSQQSAVSHFQYAPGDCGHYLCYLSRKHLPSRIRVFIDYMAERTRALDLQCLTTMTSVPAL